MKVLSRYTLPLSGFAGIKEHRLVTDSRVFTGRKKPETFEGIGNMVYLADATYVPKGESGMHPHSEIDVISIIIDGRVSHEGSLEHGKNLVAGEVQVQRAGGEGFEHNEINPDVNTNRMLQVWVLPEIKGQPAGYKSYIPTLDGVSRIYGGDENQSVTFASTTVIDIVHLQAGKIFLRAGEQLVYVITGEATFEEEYSLQRHEKHNTIEGDLIRASALQITATKNTHLLVVSTKI